MRRKASPAALLGLQERHAPRRALADGDATLRQGSTVIRHETLHKDAIGPSLYVVKVKALSNRAATSGKSEASVAWGNGRE